MLVFWLLMLAQNNSTLKDISISSIYPSNHSLIRERNIDCIVAPYEADAELAFLSTNLADFIITEDSDLTLFGCDNIVFKVHFLSFIFITFKYQGLFQIFIWYVLLTPSKSMPQNSNHDFKEKYIYILAWTLEPMRIDILTKNREVFCRARAF